MRVRIGTTLDGHAAGFDTSKARPLLLVGDVGRGKTTTARYLTRWWLADTGRHAHVYAHAPREWADLRCMPEYPDQLNQLNQQVGHECRPGACLVVVDDMDTLGDDQIALLSLGTSRMILTSYGDNNRIDRTLLEDTITCLGLIRPGKTDTAEAAVLDGQGRLDWPIGTLAVIPDQRGPMDFPCHRWQSPTGNWMAVAQ